MPTNELFFENEAERAEELIPSMTYRLLVQELGRLTQLGVVRAEDPTTMLVVARLVDRARIQQSGLRSRELKLALLSYRAGKRWKPVFAVVKALEKAVETAANHEKQNSGGNDLEDKGEATAYRAG